MKITITKDDVDHALASSSWDLGNQVLYSLCQDHPNHDRGDAIIAKIWLVGCASSEEKGCEQLSWLSRGKRDF
jgi:hypothetical protein